MSVSESRSWSASESENSSRTTGHSETVHRRPLLLPEEVGRFFGDPFEPRALALINGRPLYLHRRPYYGEIHFEGHFEPHKADGKVRLLSDVKAARCAERVAQEQAEEKERQRKRQEAELHRQAMERENEQRLLALAAAEAKRAEEAERARLERLRARRMNRLVLLVLSLAFTAFSVVTFISGWFAPEQFGKRPLLRADHVKIDF